MKKKYLRVAALILVVILAVSLVACSKETKEQYPTPTEKFFVNDFAGIMTAEDSETIYNKGVALQEKTTAQVVVVTVDSLDGKEIADYALELGREWGVGDKDKNNGVVILLSESDREVYIAVGYGLEGALPDSKTGRIIDTYGISYFENDEFSAGIASVYDVVANEIYVEYNMEVPQDYIPIDQLPQQPKESVSAVKVLLSWIALIILITLYISIFGRRGGLFIFGAPRFFGGGFHHHSGFGGFGGGSSGGFGGFRGGGGSFGGGGAGRKF